MTPLRAFLREVGVYGVCVAIAVAADFTLLAALVSGLKMEYVAATAISFVLANAFLYGLCARFVFARTARARRPLDLAIFITTSAVALGVQTLIMIFAVQTLHAHYLVAKVGAAGVTFVANFFVRRSLLFAA